MPRTKNNVASRKRRNKVMKMAKGYWGSRGSVYTVAKGEVEKLLGQEFICAHCKSPGAHVERLSMSGTGISRFMDIQPYRYAFVSCNNCGYTEVFNLRMLEGKDDLGTFLDVLFSG